MLPKSLAKTLFCACVRRISFGSRGTQFIKSPLPEPQSLPPNSSGHRGCSALSQLWGRRQTPSPCTAQSQRSKASKRGPHSPQRSWRRTFSFFAKWSFRAQSLQRGTAFSGRFKRYASSGGRFSFCKTKRQEALFPQRRQACEKSRSQGIPANAAERSSS